ncbi:MAG: DUF1206 domain-containing protein [Chloroflexota bacterium]
MNGIAHGEAREAVPRSFRRAEQGGRRLAERERRWLVPLGRAGYAANGLVYVVVGALAVQAAMGSGGDTTDTGGALGYILQAPFGRVLVGLIAIGLAGYALWRFVQAILDSEHKGDTIRGIVQRVGFGIAGATYAGLAISALSMALQRGAQPDQEQATQDHTAWLMSQPLGHWLVVLVGLVVIGVGVGQWVVAYRASFEHKLHDGELSPQTRRAITAIGRWGYVARGTAFALIGGFLVIAGLRSQPEEARGLGGALAVLAQQPLGPLLLGMVAIGLIAYGVHMLVAARYRQMVLS